MQSNTPPVIAGFNYYNQQPFPSASTSNTFPPFFGPPQAFPQMLTPSPQLKQQAFMPPGVTPPGYTPLNMPQRQPFTPFGAPPSQQPLYPYPLPPFVQPTAQPLSTYVSTQTVPSYHMSRCAACGRSVSALIF